MRILDLQRRLREVGRVRIGQQVEATNRKGEKIQRPSKLEHFRLTSRDQLVIEAAAEQWGGTAQPWAGAPDGEQWEVFTDAKSLPVIVPPGDMSFSQSYEQWTAGGCKVRCDGRWDHIADKECHCDPEARACDIHTRLSVMLPDLPGVGVWRLDTQGYYGAVELAGIVDLLASHTERGVMLPARLRLEQRSVKRTDNGKVVTRNFAVPVLDVDVHPLALTGQVSATGEIGPGAMPALTPVPSPDGVLAPSFAEQMQQVDEPSRRPPRANAAAVLPSTGIKPRTAQEAAGGAELPVEVVAQLRAGLNALGASARRAFLDRFGCPPAGLPLERVDEAVEFVEALAPFDPPPDGGDGSPPDPEREVVAFGVKDVARYAAEVFKAQYDAAPRGTKTKVVDRLRHALVYAETGGRATSLNDLEGAELHHVHRRLQMVADGQLVPEVDEDGVTFVSLATGTETRVTWVQLEAKEAA